MVLIYDSYGWSHSPKFTTDQYNSGIKPYDETKCYVRDYLDKEAKEFALQGNGNQKHTIL